MGVRLKSPNIKVAVCIPTWNRIKTLPSAINSLINQKYKEFDIHIFDNASTDDTETKISTMCHNNLYYHRYEENVGYVGNINRCLSLSSEYDWIGILHSDDIHFGESIETFLKYASIFPNAGLIFSKCHQIDTHNKIIKTKMSANVVYHAGTQAVKRSFDHIPCSSSFYNAYAINKVGKYSEEYPYSADEEYASRIANEFDIIETAEILACYRRHDEHTMVKTWAKTDFIETFEQMRIKMSSYGASQAPASAKKVKQNAAEELVYCCNTLLIYGDNKTAFKFYKNLFKKSPLNFVKPKVLIRFIIHSIPFFNKIFAKILSKSYK